MTRFLLGVLVGLAAGALLFASLLEGLSEE